jgi:hypothetical protein
MADGLGEGIGKRRVGAESDEQAFLYGSLCCLLGVAQAPPGPGQGVAAEC